MNSHIREGFVSLRSPSGVLPPPAALLLFTQAFGPASEACLRRPLSPAMCCTPWAGLWHLLAGAEKCLPHHSEQLETERFSKACDWPLPWLPGAWVLPTQWNFFLLLSASLSLSRSFPQCPDLVRPWSPPYPSPSVQSLLWTHAGRLIATIAPNPSHFPKIVLTSS